MSIKSIIAVAVVVIMFPHCHAQEDVSNAQQTSCNIEHNLQQLLYQKNPSLFIKDKLSNTMSPKNKLVLMSTIAIAGALAIEIVFLMASYPLLRDYMENAMDIDKLSDLKKPVIELLLFTVINMLVMSGSVWLWRKFLVMMKDNFDEFDIAVLKEILVHYHPSNSAVVIVDNQQYYNYRTCIPATLVPLFDALYEQYKQHGVDYLKQNAAGIVRWLEGWLEMHKRDVAVVE